MRIHCNNAAQKSLSQDDLEYLADLIINKLQPQAINLLLASFPSFKKEASEGGIGEDIGLEIDYDAESGAYGYAINLPLTDQKQLGYYVSINAAKLTDDPKSKKPVVNRGGKDIIELANTMVHEFFHVFMYDYNRTGMLGMTTPAEEREVDGKTTEEYDKVHYPHWFIEGTASAVEHNWRSRTIEFSTLRREFTDEEQYRNLYDRELLLRRYVLGLDEKQSGGTAAGVAARESSALGTTDSAVTDVAARESSGLGSTDSAATGGTAKDMASEEASGASTGTTSSTEGASGTTTSGEVSENSSGASTAAASEQANEATSEGAPAASSGTASERASAASTGTASEQANKASDASTVKASEEASDSAADLSSTEE